jgi:hypothetical protein
MYSTPIIAPTNYSYNATSGSFGNTKDSPNYQLEFLRPYLAFVGGILLTEGISSLSGKIIDVLLQRSLLSSNQDDSLGAIITQNQRNAEINYKNEKMRDIAEFFISIIPPLCFSSKKVSMGIASMFSASSNIILNLCYKRNLDAFFSGTNTDNCRNEIFDAQTSIIRSFSREYFYYLFNEFNKSFTNHERDNQSEFILKSCLIVGTALSAGIFRASLYSYNNHPPLIMSLIEDNGMLNIARNLARTISAPQSEIVNNPQLPNQDNSNQVERPPHAIVDMVFVNLINQTREEMQARQESRLEFRDESSINRSQILLTRYLDQQLQLTESSFR